MYMWQINPSNFQMNNDPDIVGVLTIFIFPLHLSSDLFELRLWVDMYVTCFTVECLVLQACRCNTRWQWLVFHPWPGEGLDGAVTVPCFQHSLVLGAWGANPKTALMCYTEHQQHHEYNMEESTFNFGKHISCILGLGFIFAALFAGKISLVI